MALPLDLNANFDPSTLAANRDRYRQRTELSNQNNMANAKMGAGMGQPPDALQNRKLAMLNQGGVPFGGRPMSNPNPSVMGMGIRPMPAQAQGLALGRDQGRGVGMQVNSNMNPVLQTQINPQDMNELPSGIKPNQAPNQLPMGPLPDGQSPMPRSPRLQRRDMLQNQLPYKRSIRMY